MTEPDSTLPPGSNLPKDSPWWARWLVANWTEGWKFLSVNVPIIAFAVIEADQASGGQVIELVPASWRPHLAAAALFFTALLRFIKQSKKEPQ